MQKDVKIAWESSQTSCYLVQKKEQTIKRKKATLLNATTL